MKLLNSTIFQATSVSIQDLRTCCSPYGIIAGTHHFVDLWARDSLFATFGADVGATKKTIATFLKYQRADGLIPYRIRLSSLSVKKYFGKPTLLSNPRADFRSYQSGGVVPDGGLMTVIATHEYLRRSGDKQFVKKYGVQLKKAIEWYENRFGTDLISEWFLCEWADSVLKVGKTLYTNILYWKASGDKKLASKLNDVFWNGTFFADWVDYRRYDYFAAHPNMLAIVFGLATKEQAESILAYAKKYCWNGWTLEENHPRYPWWRIPIGNYVVGMGDYHNRGCLWLQPGILYAVALHKVGRGRDAKEVLDKISEKIIEYNGVYEVYEKDGRPVQRFLYQAEHPFAWSAGLYLWAASLLQ